MTHHPERSRTLSKLNKFLAIAVIATAVGHFLVVNDLSTKGFVFKDLKMETNDLVAERQTMESRVSALSSYQNLNPRIQAMRLVAADSINYLNWNQQAVAKK